MPNNGYFDKPFGISGDLATVPDASQPDGSVSYTDGFGPDYALAYTDPAAKNVPRSQTNQILYDITTAIQNYQQNAFPPFITSAMNGGTPYSYSKYNMAYTGGVLYQSIVDTNTDTPPSAKWVAFPLGNFSGFTTGDVKFTMKTSADTGWVLCNDGSIGSGSSGASTRANADTVDLFTLIWNGVNNTNAPVSGGRGVSAAADFAANKTLTIPLMLGRALAVAGSGAGLTTRQLGQIFGEENHVLTTPELASHSHTASVTDPGHTHIASAYKENPGSGSPLSINRYNSDGNNDGTPSANPTTQSATTGITVSNSSTGSGTGHNTMQPTTFLNVMIKL